MRILVTGSTGAIGIPLVNELTGHGHEVTLLARAKSSRPVAELKKLFAGSVKILEGDVTEPLCGVSTGTGLELVGTFDALIHAAGVTQYYEHRREQTFRINEGGTKNALALASELEIERFAYVSTAYVAGKRPFFGENDVGSSDDVHNPYEGSKLASEEHVRKFPGEFLILRLSTVVGHRETGYIVNAGGYAGFVKGFWAQRKRLLRYPDNPFWVGVNPASTLNLITSDWTVSHVRKAVESEVFGTFHLTHPTPVRMRWLFDETFGKHFRLPITYDLSRAERTGLYNDPQWRSTQDSVEDIVEYFRPYVTRDTVFGHEHTKLIPGYVPPPPVDERTIKVQVDYMVNHLFSKKRALQTVAA